MAPPDLVMTDVEQGAALAGVQVVTVAGDVDLYSAPELLQHLAAVLARGASDLVIDLRQVAFMDSTGLGALVNVVKRARSQHTLTSVVSTSDVLLRMFLLTGLTRILPVHADLDAALRAAGGGSAEQSDAADRPDAAEG